MRYFAELTYNGTAYNGWQRQLNAPSVQQTLEESFSLLLRRETPLTGAGRTDTGVHASYYVAHFDTDEPISDTSAFVHKINSVLPADIAVTSLHCVPDESHARFDAVSREYKYYITPRKDPFRRGQVWHCRYDLDVESMNRAAQLLLAERDFTTFSKLHSANKTNICDVNTAVWRRNSQGILIFTISADRFLRGMVRSIVGTLVDVGRGKMSEENFATALRAQDRSLASGSAPAAGLYLTDVRYAAELFTPDRSRRYEPFR